MATSKSSAPAHPSTCTTREDRARALAAEHHHEIAASRNGFDYLVPSCADDTAGYRVHYDPAGAAWCECPDHEIRRNTCKHILAVALVAAGMFPADTSRRVDEGWLLEASGLTGFEYRTLTAAFLGTPRERRATAAGVLKHATRAGVCDGLTIEEQEELVRGWAKRSRRGMYHPAMLDAPPQTFGDLDPHEPQGV